MPLKIDKLYAWVMTDGDGDEAVLSFHTARFGWLPMIGADKDRVESLRSRAQLVANALGLPARLKVFSEGVEIDRVEPDRQ